VHKAIPFQIKSGFLSRRVNETIFPISDELVRLGYLTPRFDIASHGCKRKYEKKKRSLDLVWLLIWTSLYVRLTSQADFGAQ